MIRQSQIQYLISQYVHNQWENSNQLEEDQSPADNHQHVVEVKVIQKVLKLNSIYFEVWKKNLSNSYILNAVFW